MLSPAPLILAGILIAHTNKLLHAVPPVLPVMSTKRVRFGTQSVKSSSTRSGGSRSGNKATKKAKPKKRPDWDVSV